MPAESPASAPDAVVAASERLAPYALETPILAARCLGPQAQFKCENLQRTGSFKLRGALNKVLRLTAEERERGGCSAPRGRISGSLARVSSGDG